MRITGAIELLDTLLINKDTGIESYEFKVRISRYYSDPILDLALYKSVKLTMIYINRQTYFTPVNDNLFKVILGSQKTRTGSRFFIKGEYIFAFSSTENSSYIKLIHISFNSINRTNGTTSKIQRLAENSARRRNIKPKDRA